MEPFMEYEFNSSFIAQVAMFNQAVPVNTITPYYNNYSTVYVEPVGQTLDEYTCRMFRFVFLGIVCSFVCVLGLIGNALSFLVYRRDGSSPVASFLLQSLAMVDNCFLALWMIHYSIREWLNFMEIDMWYITVLRMYTFPVLYMAQMLTIWLTVAIALNRYMAVCLPYRAPHMCTINNVYTEITLLFLFAILYNIPRFFELEISDDEPYSIRRTPLGQSTLYNYIYTDGMYYCFTFFVPLLILGCLNTRVIIAFRKTQKRRQRMMTRRLQNDQNITLVMILVVLVFMLCQAPSRLVQIVWRYSYQNCNQVRFYLIHISNSLEVLNSSVNFLIYVIFRRRFTDILLKNFCLNPLLKFRPAHHRNRGSLSTHGLGLTSYGKFSLHRCTKCVRQTQTTKSESLQISGHGCDDEFARFSSRHANEERDMIMYNEAAILPQNSCSA